MIGAVFDDDRRNVLPFGKPGAEGRQKVEPRLNNSKVKLLIL